MDWTLIGEKWWVYCLIFVFGFGGTIFTAYQYYDADVASKENKDLNEKLLLKTESIQDFQKEALKVVQGDGYAMVMPNLDNPPYITFSLFNDTDYTIYDVNVMIYSYNVIHAQNPQIIGEDVFLKPAQWVNARLDADRPDFNLQPQSVWHTPIKLKLDATDQFLLFRIFTRNMKTMQYYYIRYDREVEAFKLSTRIYDVSGKSYKHRFLKSVDDPFDDEFWNKHFYVDKYTRMSM